MIYDFIAYYLNYIYKLCCVSSSKKKKIIHIEKQTSITNKEDTLFNLTYNNYTNLFYLTYNFKENNLIYLKKNLKKGDIITFDLISKIKKECLCNTNNIYIYNNKIYKISINKNKNNYINILKSLYYNKLNNIVLPEKIFNSINSKETIQIFNYYKDGDLYDYLFNNNFKFKYYNIYNIILKIALTIKNIHNINISHRDIKFENFLINKNKNYLELFLTDFEFATFSNVNVNFRGGTYIYAAPELFKDLNIYNFKPCDIWSFCVILYSLIMGNYPWEKANHCCDIFTYKMYNPNKMLYDILQLKLPLNHKIKYMKILKKGFDLNYNQRIDINEIIDILTN